VTNATTRYLDNAADMLNLQVDKLLRVRAATAGGIQKIDSMEIDVIAEDAREVVWAVRAGLEQAEKAYALLKAEADRRGVWAPTNV
jgi:hypothetical protein